MVAGRLPLAGGPWRRRRCGSDRPLAMQGDRPASGGQISGGWHVAAAGSWPAGRWRVAAQGDRHSDAPGCRRVCMRIIKIASDLLFFPKVGRCINIFETAHPIHDAVRMRIKTLKPNTMRYTVQRVVRQGAHGRQSVPRPSVCHLHAYAGEQLRAPASGQNATAPRSGVHIEDNILQLPNGAARHRNCVR